MALFSIIGGVFSAVMVFILTFFFTTFQDGITHNLMQLVPTAYQARTREVAHHAAQKMGGWLRGQITLALIITTLITAGMMFPAPHYAILLGIIAGVGELIPMVGPYLAFLPAILIVLLLGGHSGHIVYVAVFFILITMTENYILAPKIMQKNVGLHPVSTVLAMFTGGSLLGIVGALLAIPLTAAGRVIMLEAIFPAIHGITTEATPAIPATKKHKTGHGKAAVQPTETT
jgi:predicted PurR-regulated permease PerM